MKVDLKSTDKKTHRLADSGCFTHMVIPPENNRGSKIEFSCNLQRGSSAMKKSKFSDSEIMAILKQGEGGVLVAELCREHGMSSATFYKWHSRYGGMDVAMLS